MQHILVLLVLCSLVYGFLCSSTVGVPVFVKEGDSVTLNTDIEKDQREEGRRNVIVWTFHHINIAILSYFYSCIDIQCDGVFGGSFGDRLKLDNQTGSLTITNITTSDFGLYHLKINHNTISRKIFIVAVQGVLGASIGGESVFAMEGDSVTLYSGGKMDQQFNLNWLFNDIQIAEITADQSKICTDDQCKERFTDRLMVNPETGSLTITDSKNTDSGLYQLEIISNDWNRTEVFGVAVHGVSAAEREKIRTKSLNEGQSVTFVPGVRMYPYILIIWHFNDTCIIQNELPRPGWCKYGEERFRDRLTLNEYTGSLTITNITITDSGVYTLKFNSGRSTRSSIGFIMSFSVSVIRLSSVFLDGLYIVAGVVAVSVLLLVASAAAVIYCWKRQERKNGSEKKSSDEVNSVEDSPLDQNDTLLMEKINESSLNQTEAASEMPI